MVTAITLIVCIHYKTGNIEVSKPYVFFENIANSTCEMFHLKNVLFLKYELISKLFRNALLALKSFFVDWRIKHSLSKQHKKEYLKNEVRSIYL